MAGGQWAVMFQETIRALREKRIREEQEQEKRSREMMFPKNVRHVEVEQADEKAEDEVSNSKKRKWDEMDAKERTRIVPFKIAPNLIKPQDPQATSIDVSPSLNQPESTCLHSDIPLPLATASQSQPLLESTPSNPVAPTDSLLPNPLPSPSTNSPHPSIEQPPPIPSPPRPRGRPRLDPTLAPAQRLLNLLLRTHDRGIIQIAPCLRCFKTRRQCVKDTRGDQKSCTHCRYSRCRCEGAVELGTWIQVNGTSVHLRPSPQRFCLPVPLCGRLLGALFIIDCRFGRMAPMMRYCGIELKYL